MVAGVEEEDALENAVVDVLLDTLALSPSATRSAREEAGHGALCLGMVGDIPDDDATFTIHRRSRHGLGESRGCRSCKTVHRPSCLCQSLTVVE